MKPKDVGFVFSQTMLAMYALSFKKELLMKEWSKESGVVYSHLYTIRKLLYDEKLIDYYNDEKKKFWHLTDKGRQITEQISVLIKMFNIGDELFKAYLNIKNVEFKKETKEKPKIVTFNLIEFIGDKNV